MKSKLETMLALFAAAGVGLATVACDRDSDLEDAAEEIDDGVEDAAEELD